MLRIIRLFEAGFNFLLALVFGCCLMKFARTYCGFDKSQYGSMEGKQAQSAILNNILTYNYFCLTKENCSTSEFDFQANYNRIIPSLAVIACQHLGLGRKSVDLL